MEPGPGSTGRRLVSALLDCGRAEKGPFPRPVPRRRADRLVRSAQIWGARVRRGYPASPPEFRRLARSWRIGGPGPGPAAPPARSRPLILGLATAWNEDDVIWATVRNLFAEGADEVFVIDDESSDDTRSEARDAGATVLAESNGGVFSEALRGERVRRVVREQTALRGNDAWWVVVDADELPRGPGGATIRAFVSDLPAWVDVVGSRVLEHLPGSTSSYRPRTHPATSIPLARWHNNPYCPAGHWKHQLFRVRDPADLFPMPAAHTVGTGDRRRAREAAPSLLMHHVPFRDRARTEAKLHAAAEGRYAAGDPEIRVRLANRLAIVDDLYGDRYDAVPNHFFPGERRVGLALRDWRQLVPAAERTLPRLEPDGTA